MRLRDIIVMAGHASQPRRFLFPRIRLRMALGAIADVLREDNVTKRILGDCGCYIPSYRSECLTPFRERNWSTTIIPPLEIIIVAVHAIPTANTSEAVLQVAARERRFKTSALG